MKTLMSEKEAIRDTASSIMQSLTELENINLNHKERRELQKKLQRLVKKNGFHLETILSNGDEVNQFVLNVFDGGVKESEDGVKITIKFLREQKTDSGLDTQPRSYQREKVASYEWKCEIIKTILIDKTYKIPAIHIRIVRNENGDVIGYEVADGQQRVTAVFDFMDNKFTLPEQKKDPSFGRYCGMNWNKLLMLEPDACDEIRNYGIATTFYDNFTDEDISTLFIKILNNTNDLNVQEKNNATRSRLADFVRYTSRNGNGEWKDKADMFHALFSRDTLNRGTPKEETVWKYFNSLGIGRMQGDQWLAMLVYMVVTDNWKNGVTALSVSKFYEETSVSSGHEFGWNFKDKLSINSMPKIEKEVTDLLNVALKFAKWILKYKTTTTDKKGKVVRKVSNAKAYLKHNFMFFVILFARDYKEAMKSGAVDWDLYFEKITDVYDKWNKPSVYEKDENGNSRYQWNGTTMLGAFKALWGSFNPNVIKTALDIISSEIALDPDWGFVEIDRKNFTNKQIEQRYDENGGIDDYTGKPTPLEDLVGDHDIPRAWGIAKGGVTEYSNLKITTAYHNGQKLTMTGEAYMAKLSEDKKAA
tara:strand:- start:99 stop:1865 length:1767 start_codon:yes stop_codon:yes gene_type:complete